MSITGLRAGSPVGGPALPVSVLLGCLLAGACEPPTIVVEQPYLAIVALLDVAPGASPGTEYEYRVTERSGTLALDTTIVVAPGDTLILPLLPATYQVSMAGLPHSCRSRYGASQYVTVYDGPTTSIARYYITCHPMLTVVTASEGAAPDPELVYRLVMPGGDQRIGIMSSNDTLHFASLPPGDYEFVTSHVAPHCTVTSPGGTRAVVTVPSAGGSLLTVRIACSDEAARPRLLSFRASYAGGASAFTFRATDPDRDIEHYWWDVTDCRATSVLPSGARLRRGLSSGHTAGRDTVVVVAAFEVRLTDAELAGRCTAIRVVDENGNTTPLVEWPIAATAGRAPSASSFNAVLRDTSTLRVTLAAGDADGDFVGTFAAARLRDGTLGPPDGQSDLGVYNAAGYPGTAVPDLPLGTRIHFGDVYGVIVYLVDRAGNFTRLEDSDVFR